MEVAKSDPDPEVRKQAQIGIQELWPGGKKGFDNTLFTFIEGLRDPKSRPYSLMIIPSFGEMAIPTLKMYLMDPDPELRKYITQIIIDIEKYRQDQIY